MKTFEKHVTHSCLWRQHSAIRYSILESKTIEEEKGAGSLALLCLTLTDMKS